MGGGVILFGLSVILIFILGSRHEAEAGPVPASADYQICAHYHLHGHRATTTPAPGTTTGAPKKDKADKPKDEIIDKIDKFLREIFDTAKDKKKEEDEEEEKKKKEEEDKKKEEEEKKKKEEEEKKNQKKKERPRGIENLDKMWENYISFLDGLWYMI